MMQQLKSFRVFALLLGKRLYIGKTFSRRLSAVYHRHCRGEIIATACFSESTPKPTLHVLHSAEMQTFVAYRYILAFIHFFRDAGYDILNCPRSIERSENLHPATQAIVDTLEFSSPEDLLKDTLIMNPTDADIPSEKNIPQPVEEIADQKLTIRLTPSEKQNYIRIGENLSLNQRDTMRYLFDKCNQTDPVFLDLEGDSYLRVLINAYREEIEKTKSQNTSLRKKLTATRESAKAQSERLQKDLSSVASEICCYLDLMENAVPIPLEIEYGLYRDTAEAENYKYPEAAGIYLIRPQMVLRGNGRYSALFIMGIGENGALLKFRYYKKKNYIGIPIPDSRFSTRGSVWLVTCKIANDGAFDLTGSLPLTVRFNP